MNETPNQVGLLSGPSRNDALRWLLNGWANLMDLAGAVRRGRGHRVAINQTNKGGGLAPGTPANAISRLQKVDLFLERRRSAGVGCPTAPPSSSFSWSMSKGGQKGQKTAEKENPTPDLGGTGGLLSVSRQTQKTAGC